VAGLVGADGITSKPDADLPAFSFHPSNPARKGSAPAYDPGWLRAVRPVSFHQTT
jgi:hypothetical protein